jgi:hypothetical protein
MIDLTQTTSGSPLIHTVPTDPGTTWTKQAVPAVDAPPDNEIEPAPQAQWPMAEKRTGLSGVVSPRIIALPEGGYRLYYTQILPRPGNPAGANDYDQATSRILSAVSPDGSTWTPEAGVRLSAADGGAGEFRVASAEVVPLSNDGRVDGVDGLRMYYECCPGPQSIQNSIRSAVSIDGGLVWRPEPETRLETSGCNYTSPRIVYLDHRRCRLYCCERGTGIISALSEDGGLTFQQEAGIRIAPDGPYDRVVAFAAEILKIADSGYRMYYAGYGASNRADILTATSDDGLNWQKVAEPVISPDDAKWDRAKCSEMCVMQLPHRAGETPRYQMLYEACDGTAIDQRGVWRIAAARSAE